MATQTLSLPAQRKALRLPRFNGPLILGLIIVALVGLLALQGPSLSPKDPNERLKQLRVDGKWITAPFPPLTPGYPLGSDGDGRDMLSRILWGFQPTMAMVLIVASIRLLMGTVIGMGAGWFQGRVARMLDTLISTALAIPVIMVALGGIAAVGVDLGIWAFVVGLSLTGWVETARLVRERTAAIRGQVYIEAAHSLGAGNLQMLFKHVMRQVISMIWMLFAFEVSSTLMLTASLGFLGYYIGGDVWVQVTDAFAEATSGTPELGQMLATTDSLLTRPWPLLMIGVVVFITVLGFNLLGEGLRRRASHTVPRGRTFLDEPLAKFLLAVEDRVLWPLGNLSRTRSFRVGATLMVVVGLGMVGWPGIQARYFAGPPPAPVTFDTPMWPTARGDAAGTRYTRATGPQTGQIAWTFNDPDGFAGGPAIAQDGTVYVTGKSATLYALTPSGELLWRTRLPAEPSTGPGLNAHGEIFVGDVDGGLTALSPTGKQLWHVDADKPVAASASPIVAADGTIFYPTGPSLRTVSPDGTVGWVASVSASASGLDSVLVSDAVAFFGTYTFDLHDGTSLNLLPASDVDQYLIGADGQTYYRNGNDIYPWTLETNMLQAAAPIAWDYEKFSTGRPQTSGVTLDGSIWLFYSSFARGFGFGEDTRLVWLDQKGEVHGNINYPTRNSSPVAVDAQKTLYSCGNLNRGYGALDCQAFAFGAEEPLWTLNVDGDEMAGAAVAPGRMYVATKDGFLHAIGDANPAESGTANGTASESDATPAAFTPGEPQFPSVTEPVEMFSDAFGFSGAPIYADGKIFIANTHDTLYALSPEGEILWQITLPDKAIGTPALTDTTLYMTDKTGLTAFSLDGKQLWRFEQDKGSAVAGPAIGPDGALYYTLSFGSKGAIQAVSPEGTALWQMPVKTVSYYRSPKVSPNGQFVIFRGEVYDARDGSAVDLGLEVKPDEIILGADGKLYVRLQDTVAQFTFSGGHAVLSENRVIATVTNPTSIGVTADGVVWIVTRNGLEWYAPDGAALGTSAINGSFSTIFGVDSQLTLYACGRDRNQRQGGKLYCAALQMTSDTPIWEIITPTITDQVSDGLLLPDRLIFTTETGKMYEMVGEQ